MNKFLILLAWFLLVCGTAGVCGAVSYGGVDFPGGIASFADAVVSYNPGPDVDMSRRDPTTALGVPNYVSGSGQNYVALGNNGELILQFTDNSLTTSGNNDLDLWIFEIGTAVEPTDISISTNGIDWIDVGRIEGATSGVDIDDFIGSGVVLGELYRFVRIMDANAGQSGPPDPGADIDAVGAISSVPSTAPVPEPATLLLVGCGLAGLLGFGRKKLKK